MTDLTIGGETFNVLIEGDETLPVLMLSNPLGADLHIWDAQIQDLLKHFRIVRYNQRGHGTSVADAGPYSIDRLGRDALAILDALDVEKAHWLGMSLGGAVGQWLLINAPERIERAVLANTAATFGSAESWNDRIVTVQQDGLDAIADTTMDRWFSPAFMERNAERTSEVRQALVATPAHGYAATCAALRDMDLREGLRQIQRPVLVIAGTGDTSATPEKAAQMVEAIAGAKLVTLETHHIAAVEDAAGFTKAVIDFLTAKLPAQTASRKSPLARPIARRPAGRRTPTMRNAATEAIVRRGAIKAAPAKTKARDAQAAPAPAKASRPKTSAAAGTPTLKRAAPKTAPAAKTGRKTSTPTAPAKRAVAKAAPAKISASRSAASRSAAPKAGARGSRVAVPAKLVKPTKGPAAKAAKPAAKTSSRKAPVPVAPSGRKKAAPRGGAKPATAAKKVAVAAKPNPSRRAAAAKTPTKRSVATAAKTRAVSKLKAKAKAVAKSVTKPAVKPKAPAAKSKAPARTTKTAKPAAKSTARKPAPRAAAKRPGTRRKP